MTATQREVRMTPAAHRILDAASRLYYDRGITSVGMDLVAEHAGTTKKTIYDRFGSKDGLVVAYLEARARRWQAHVDAHLAASSATGVDRVLAVLDALESWLAAGSRGCGFVNAYAELSTQSPAATRIVHAEKARLRQLFVDLLAEAGFTEAGLPEAGSTHAEGLGRQLALLHEGAIVELTAGGSPQALDDARDAMRRLLS